MRALRATRHLLPVVARRSRQLNTQKPPVTEQSVTPAEVPPKAASRGQAEEGHNRSSPLCVGQGQTPTFGSKKNQALGNFLLSTLLLLECIRRFIHQTQEMLAPWITSETSNFSTIVDKHKGW